MVHQVVVRRRQVVQWNSLSSYLFIYYLFYGSRHIEKHYMTQSYQEHNATHTQAARLKARRTIQRENIFVWELVDYDAFWLFVYLHLKISIFTYLLIRDDYTIRVATSLWCEWCGCKRSYECVTKYFSEHCKIFVENS